MPRVFVNIVTWNSMKYLPWLLDSLREQTFRDFSILAIDNASTDGVISTLREQYPEVTILRNFNNLGFAVAHNQGIKYALASLGTSSPDHHYVLVANPDLILTPTFLEELMRESDDHARVAAFGGKLLRAELREMDGIPEPVFTRTIDSTGLRLARSRRVADRGAGEEDRGQYDAEREVFGISGALALYHLSALARVEIGGEYFDEQFFAYKEDVDLAWRLRLVGESARYVPGARAHHYRATFGRERANAFEFLGNRKIKSPLTNYLSYRNHLSLLVKNECWSNGIRHFPWIFCYECAKFFSLIFFEPRTIAAWFDFWRTLPGMIRKRAQVMSRRRLSPREMRRWFE